MGCLTPSPHVIEFLNLLFFGSDSILFLFLSLGALFCLETATLVQLVKWFGITQQIGGVVLFSLKSEGSIEKLKNEDQNGNRMKI